MNSATFLHRLDNLITGNGFKCVIPGVNIQSLTEEDGDRLDNSSTPPYAAFETSGLGMAQASSTTFLGELDVVVPQDYDKSDDYLRIRLLAQSAGDTNTPTIDAAIYSKRAGSALGSDLDPTISAAVANNTANGGWVEINADGNSLQGGDALHIELVTSAHTTDALHIYALELVYKSDLVYFNKANR